MQQYESETVEGRPELVISSIASAYASLGYEAQQNQPHRECLWLKKGRLPPEDWGRKSLRN